MSNIFEKSLPLSKPKRSVFDLSRDYKTSFNMGSLIPVYLEEVIPGDTFKVGSDIMIRFAPLIAPIMDRVDVRLDYFFVPTRLCVNECNCYHVDVKKSKLSFEDFITGGKDGKEIAPLPSITMPGDYFAEYAPANSLLDYFGFFMNDADSLTHDDTITIPNITPLLAYHLVCDNFFLDQTFDVPFSDYLEDLTFDSISGVYEADVQEHAIDALFSVRQRCFGKDYFTTAMPAPQRGDSVYLTNPLTITSDLEGSFNIGSRDLDTWTNNFAPTPTFRKVGGGSIPSGQHNLYIEPQDASNSGYLMADTSQWDANLQFDNTGIVAHLPDISGNVEVDGDISIDGYEAVTINDFFTLQSIQRWLNHNQNFGGRYVEQLVGHFGVVPSDARLNLPQYLGGGKAPVMISEVLQTASNSTEGTSDNTGVGEMAGHAMAFGKTASFRRSFNEHGLILGILSVVPKNSYTTAVPKIFFKNDKFDFAFPEFSNIGEQPIKNKEIFLQKDSDENDATFGYTPRYAEYRCAQSLSTGYFRTSLNFWHLGRVFAELPTLNDGFLKVTNDKTKRIFQTTPSTSVMSIYCDCYHNVTAIRPLPLLPNTSLL